MGCPARPRLLLAAALLILPACSGETLQDDPFFLHPRFIEALERAETDPDFPYRPEATEWSPPPEPLPGSGTLLAPSPSELLERIVALLSRDDDPSPEGELDTAVRLRDLTDTTATAGILRYGYLDDSVAGEAWRLELRRGGDGWYVTEAAHRWFCRRGSTDGICL